MMWPSLFTLMVVSSPGPTTPMNWMSLGKSEAAESVNALHTVFEREERIDNAELKALAPEDRAYFEARQYALDNDVEALYRALERVESIELQTDLRRRWLKTFAETKDTLNRTRWKQFEQELMKLFPKFDSGLNASLRRFALERPGQALACFGRLLKRVESGTQVEGQLTYMAIVAQLELKPVDATKLANLRQTLYTAHPLHALTPRKPPRGVAFPPERWLQRIELLIEGHLNERGLEELKRFKKGRKLTSSQSCRVHFLEGLAYRKLRKYKTAESALEKAARQCKEKDYKRRGHYLWAKVVSIRDGLAAIQPIESFVKNFPGHSMTDDVLFWAGDVYQRRERWEEADAYYAKVEQPAYRGDYCAEARWRRAWMSFVNEDWKSAASKLRNATKLDCDVSAQALARAEYWLGMVELKLGNNEAALGAWETLIKRSPLSFYSQIALGRLPELAPSKRLAWAKFLPSQDAPINFCPGTLSEEGAWHAALKWLDRGYLDLAKQALRSIEWETQVLGKGEGCEVQHPEIVEAFGYRRLGDDDRGYRILRSLWKVPAGQAELIGNKRYLSLLYPDLYSSVLASSEKTYGLPAYFLQALAREESSFHAQIASWAGARGLLQLMPGTAKRIAKRAKIRYKGEGDLLDPVTNASLGGALMRELSRKFKGDPASMLAGYNASQKSSAAWRSRYLEKDVDHMIENITVKETRKYVKRVLETWGIYKWLYGQQAIALKPWQVGTKLTWTEGR